uniref:Uncharacterized protein n=1 Tax=Siphoviridae sp. ctvyM23 TaxID=2826514 RepID=A0A8S5MHN0_9CAUD|nr:MAG TPA: hypothetical protein [Siphoviridae sp. ctvyM23]
MIFHITLHKFFLIFQIHAPYSNAKFNKSANKSLKI